MDRDEQFERLMNEVAACRRCPRMCDSIRVLNRGCGAVDASVMFVGEAPGRLGADRSVLPFHGDKAGHNFEVLLEFAGLSREHVFITNAILCNPRDENGNNATPTPQEVKNCASHLRRQIEIVAPRLVVTLGATALRACAQIEPHTLSLAQHVRTSFHWYGRELIPLYHPGQRAMLHRSMANQRSDYRYVSERLSKSGSKKRTVTSATSSSRVRAIAERIVALRSDLSYFALHKLMYLVEYHFYKKTGARATPAYYVRQKDGPYCVDLHPNRLRESSIEFVSGKSGLRLESTIRSDLFELAGNVLDEETDEAVRTVVAQYGSLPDSRLKTVVYLTQPMRAMLRRERAGSNLYNAPITFGGTETEVANGLRQPNCRTG